MTFFQNKPTIGENFDPHVIHEKILRSAQCSGTLSLPNRELKYVPPSVWNLNTPLPPKESVVNFETTGDDSRWWETQLITKLVLSSNKIRKLEGHGLTQLNTLVYLDVRDNCLTELPKEIEALTELTQLIVSSNQIVYIPSSLVNLKSLVWLDISHNALQELPENFGELSALEKCDLSDNKLTRLPSHFPTKLLSLDIKNNNVTELPKGLLESAINLKDFNASHNKLASIVLEDNSSNSSALTVINLRTNYLTEIPRLSCFKQLKELLLGENKIDTFTLECITGLHNLVTIDLSRNKLTTIPFGLPVTLPNLVRLDVSNNELTSIPTELGFLEPLQVLALHGNPLNSIGQTILNSGTHALKYLLCNRHQSNDKDKGSSTNQNATCETAAQSPGTTIVTLNLPHVNPSGLLDWSAVQIRTKGGFNQPNGTPISDLPSLEDAQLWWKMAMPEGAEVISVRNIKLASRMLQVFPLGVMVFHESLTVLDLSHNRLHTLPDDIVLLQKLQELNLTSNCLASLNPKLTNLSALQRLTLDYNPTLGPQLPVDVLCQPPLSLCLENLSARGCKLTSLPPASELSPTNMPALTSLDISENDIATLQPELGLCSQIRSLQVSGNAFKIPRPATIAKGTGAIMEYLRSRIVG